MSVMVSQRSIGEVVRSIFDNATGRQRTRESGSPLGELSYHNGKRRKKSALRHAGNGSDDRGAAHVAGTGGASGGEESGDEFGHPIATTGFRSKRDGWPSLIIRNDPRQLSFGF